MMSEMEIRKEATGYAVVHGRYVIAQGNRPLAAVQELVKKLPGLLDEAARLEGEIVSRNLAFERAEIEERAIEDFLQRVNNLGSS